jgi:hypothetical protein
VVRAGSHQKPHQVKASTGKKSNEMTKDFCKLCPGRARTKNDIATVTMRKVVERNGSAEAIGNGRCKRGKPVNREAKNIVVKAPDHSWNHPHTP